MTAPTPNPISEGGKPNPGTKPDGRLKANKGKGGGSTGKAGKSGGGKK
jgi:hypothetical protein